MNLVMCIRFLIRACIILELLSTHTDARTLYTVDTTANDSSIASHRGTFKVDYCAFSLSVLNPRDSNCSLTFICPTSSSR